MKARFVLTVLHVAMLACVFWPFSAVAENAYVGTAACKDCHEEQYENFTKFAKKAQFVELNRKALDAGYNLARKIAGDRKG